MGGWVGKWISRRRVRFIVFDVPGPQEVSLPRYCLLHRIFWPLGRVRMGSTLSLAPWTWSI